MLHLIYHLVVWENSILEKNNNCRWSKVKTPQTDFTGDLEIREATVAKRKGKEIPKENLLNWLFNYNVNICYQKWDGDREAKGTKTGQREPELPLCTQATWERPAPAPICFIHPQGRSSCNLGRLRGYLQVKWFLGLYSCQRIGTLRTSVMALRTGVQVTQDRWLGPAQSWGLRQSPFFLLSVHLYSLNPREREWTGATTHRLGKEGGESDTWSQTQIMGQCPEALRQNDLLATETHYF